MSKVLGAHAHALAHIPHYCNIGPIATQIPPLFFQERALPWPRASPSAASPRPPAAAFNGTCRAPLSALPSVRQRRPTAAATMKNFLKTLHSFRSFEVFSEIDFAVAIQSVRKSSTLELSSRFFRRLKMFRNDMRIWDSNYLRYESAPGIILDARLEVLMGRCRSCF